VAAAFSAKQATRFISDAFKGISRLRCPARKMWDTIIIGWERENHSPSVAISNGFGGCERLFWLFPLPSDGRGGVREVLLEIRLLSGICLCTNP